MKKIFLLLIIILLISCGKYDKELKNIYNKVSDIEPNDDLDHSNAVLSSDPIVGFFNKKNKNDIDFYKVSIPLKDISYEISLTAVPGIDSKLKVYDEKSRLLYTIDETGKGEAEKLWEFYPKTGIIYISVESKAGYNEKVPYVINFIKKEDAPVEEIEPNNTEAEATPIKLGETKRGFISPKTDVDYYKIVFEDDQIHDFSIEAETLSNIDINFILFNKSTGNFKTINNFSWGGTETFSYLSSNKGIYYIKVSGKISDDKKDPLYYLSIKELKNTTEDNMEIFYEREDNDSQDLATEMITGSEIQGNFNPAKDNDWYKFDLFKKPVSVDLSLSRVKGVDPIMEIYDENKKLISKINNNGKDNGEQISLNNLEKGKYFIRLYADDCSLIIYKLYFYIRYE